MPNIVIAGAQWGDEGKGKIVDLLAQDSDLVCRYQGGPNAGHTIVVDGETYKIRQIPSGIVAGKASAIGAGCVVDPRVVIEELDDLESRGHATAGLVFVSGNAHLIMPWHVALDGARERKLGNLQIGTTRRGIGPAYADKARRIGIRAGEVLDAAAFANSVRVQAVAHNSEITALGGDALDVDAVVDSSGNVSGEMLNMAYVSLMPFRLMQQKYVSLVDILKDPRQVENFMRMEKWIFDSPDQAGDAFRQFTQWFFQENRLVKGTVELGGRKVDLKQITQPVLNIYGRQDHLVPPSASIPMERYLGSKDYTAFEMDVGHIGMYVSGKSQKQLPETIAQWLKDRE